MAGRRAFDDGRAGGERRQDGQHHARRGVQAGELGVAREGQIQMHALQVGLAVLAAAEDAVVGPVDLGLGVRPQPRLAGGIHPRMHAGRHQPRAERREPGVDRAHLVLEAGRQEFERRLRAGVLELDEVEHDLVGPGVAAAPDLGAAAGRLQQGVGDRHHRERVAVDDHVLELDAVAGEGVQGGHDQGVTRLRASMRRTNEPMISR